MSLQTGDGSLQGLLLPDFIPTRDQQIVRYLRDQGDNLHVIKYPNGSSNVASIPNALRQLIQPAKGDCLVIESNGESGNNRVDQIVSPIAVDRVLDLIKSGRWPEKFTDEDNLKSNLVNFFNSGVDESIGCAVIQSVSACATPPRPQSSDWMESVEKDRNVEKVKVIRVEERGRDSDCEEASVARKCEEDLGFKSCVQFLTSGVVTVASVAEMSSVEHGIQSLDFETEESSEESTSPLPINLKDFQRQANTIRIQVNYPRGMESLEKRRNSSTLSADFIQST